LNIRGWVKEISIRSSMIQDVDGREIVFPNQTLTNNPVKNLDSQPAYQIHVPLRLHHDTSADEIETALSLLCDIATQNENIGDEFWAGFSSIGDNSFNVELTYQIRKWQLEDKKQFRDEDAKILMIQTEVNLEIIRQFITHNINLAMTGKNRLGAKNIRDKADMKDEHDNQGVVALTGVEEMSVE